MNMKDLIVKGMVRVIEEQAKEMAMIPVDFLDAVVKEYRSQIEVTTINQAVTLEQIEMEMTLPDQATEQLASTIIRGIVPDAMNVGMVWTFEDILRETEFMVKTDKPNMEFVSGKKLYNMILKNEIEGTQMISDLYQRDIATGQYMAIRKFKPFRDELVKQYEYK